MSLPGTRRRPSRCREPSSALKKSERVLDRPFQNLPGEERPGARRKQWVAIWGEVECSPPIGQTLLDAAKASPLFKITAEVLKVILKNVTDKAGGLDGLTYAALKNLPGPAYEQLTQVLNLAETTGVARRPRSASSEEGLPPSLLGATKPRECHPPGDRSSGLPWLNSVADRKWAT